MVQVLLPVVLVFKCVLSVVFNQGVCCLYGCIRVNGAYGVVSGCGVPVGLYQVEWGLWCYIKVCDVCSVVY